MSFLERFKGKMNKVGQGGIHELIGSTSQNPVTKQAGSFQTNTTGFHQYNKEMVPERDPARETVFTEPNRSAYNSRPTFESPQAPPSYSMKKTPTPSTDYNTADEIEQHVGKFIAPNELKNSATPSERFKRNAPRKSNLTSAGNQIIANSALSSKQSHRMEQQTPPSQPSEYDTRYQENTDYNIDPIEEANPDLEFSQNMRGDFPTPKGAKKPVEIPTPASEKSGRSARKSYA